MTADLAAWLGEQIDHDEQVALAATPGPWHALDGGVINDDEDQWPVANTESARNREDRVHIALHDPARVLRQVAAHRAIVKMYKNAVTARDGGSVSAWNRGVDHGAADVLGDVVRSVAAIYSDRPGYQEGFVRPQPS